MSVLELFSITLGFTSVVIYWVWLRAIKIENFSIIDAAWSAGFTLQSLIFFTVSEGYLNRKLLFFAMLCLWSLRLTYFLGQSISSQHPIENSRYIQLRTEYGIHYKKRFLIFFMIQAVGDGF